MIKRLKIHIFPFRSGVFLCPQFAYQMLPWRACANVWKYKIMLSTLATYPLSHSLCVVYVCAVFESAARCWTKTAEHKKEIPSKWPLNTLHIMTSYAQYRAVCPDRIMIPWCKLWTHVTGRRTRDEANGKEWWFFSIIIDHRELIKHAVPCGSGTLMVIGGRWQRFLFAATSVFWWAAQFMVCVCVAKQLAEMI